MSAPSFPVTRYWLGAPREVDLRGDDLTNRQLVMLRLVVDRPTRQDLQTAFVAAELATLEQVNAVVWKTYLSLRCNGLIDDGFLTSETPARWS